MPAILTHYCFAIMTLDDSSRVFEDVYRLGNQGPDVFMAYGAVPWHKRVSKKEIYNVGCELHHTHMTDCYFKCLQYALTRPDKEKQMLLTYMEGCFAHYALDRIAHAYIFYRTGFDENGELHGFYKWSHGFFEAILDKSLTKRKGIRIKPSKAIKVDEDRLKAISKMWKACGPAVLQEDSFYLAQRDYVSSMNLIQTRTGWIRPLLKKLMGKYSAAYAQAMPGKLGKYEVVDPQNLKKAEWLDPATGEKHNESIDEIFLFAQQSMKELKGILSALIEGKDIHKALAAWEKNLDHDGTPYGDTKKYKKLCWEKGEQEI